MPGPQKFVTDLNSEAGHAAARAVLEQQRALWVMPALEYNISAMTVAEGRALAAGLAHGAPMMRHMLHALTVTDAIAQPPTKPCRSNACRLAK